MWTREELKDNAKKALHGHYWTCLLVSVIVAIFSGTMGFDTINRRLEININEESLHHGNYINVNFDEIELFEQAFEFLGIAISFIFLFMLISIVLFLLDVFFIGPMKVGKMRFYLNNAYGNATIKDLFSVFRDPYYLNIVKIVLLKDIKLLLWTLCFVIPGIYKSYEYYMIPMLLAEDSSKSSNEVFYQSKLMTDNQKFDIFVLELSFFGWLLLGSLFFNIGQIFVDPYICAVDVELFLACKERVIDYEEVHEEFY